MCIRLAKRTAAHDVGTKVTSSLVVVNEDDS